MKYIFFWILLFSSILSCSSDKPRKTQAAECYVRYLVPEGRILAELTLREGEPGQKAVNPVVSPGGARYQGILMNELSDEGVVYQLSSPGGYTQEHVFSWSDDQKQTRKFAMSLAPITSFSFGSKSISRQTPATFTWEGAPLEKGEGLVFLWESLDRLKTLPMEIIGTPGQHQIDFPAAKLAELAPGDWTLYLVRKKVSATDLDGVEITGLAEYYTQVDTFMVK